MPDLVVAEVPEKARYPILASYFSQNSAKDSSILVLLRGFLNLRPTAEML